jgi:hypothetical protein
VEKELTGKDSEPLELIYFKIYKSQIAIIEQAIETAALMLGPDKSRGYCLEMICADFWLEPTWTAAIPRSCCARFHATTSFFPLRSRGFSYPKSQVEPRERDPLQAAN